MGSDRLKMIEQTEQALVGIIDLRIRAACHTRDAFLKESVQDREPEFFLGSEEVVEAAFRNTRS